MSAKPPSEVLYDSEATLRLVDMAIHEMGDIGTVEPPSPEHREREAMAQRTASPRTSLGRFGHSDLLARGDAEILGVLDSLRQSRHHFERATVEKFQQTHVRLREVSDATESAATDILNGLDRATSMVDELDAYAGHNAEPDDRAAIIRSALRDEMFSVKGHRQLQNITSQQLIYAAERQAVADEIIARKRPHAWSLLVARVRHCFRFVGKVPCVR